MPGGHWNTFPELYPENQLDYVEYIDESMKPEQESIASRLNRFHGLLNKHVKIIKQFFEI